MKKILKISAIFLLMLPFSCKKSDEPNLNIENKMISDKYVNIEISLKENWENSNTKGIMLTFKNYDEFQLMTSKIGKMSSSEIIAFENSFIGFTSLRNIFDQIIREEEVNYEIENKSKNSYHQNTSIIEKNKNVFIKDNENGYDINIADYRLSSVVNSSGMVKIGNYIYQFTKNKNKAILDDKNLKDEMQLLINTNDTDQSIGVIIATNKILKTNSNSKIMADPYASRSCDVMDNGSSPHDYRLITYEESILNEIPVGAVTYTNVTTSIPTLSATGVITYTNVTYPVAVQSGRIYYSTHQVKLRTLKRGLFGAWYNADTAQQSVSGDFSLTGNVTYSYSPFGVLNGSLHYYKDPQGNSTSTFCVTLAESGRFPDAATASNCRFSNSSQHHSTFTRENKTCNCNI